MVNLLSILALEPSSNLTSTLPSSLTITSEISELVFTSLTAALTLSFSPAVRLSLSPTGVFLTELLTFAAAASELSCKARLASSIILTMLLTSV